VSVEAAPTPGARAPLLRSRPRAGTDWGPRPRGARGRRTRPAGRGRRTRFPPARSPLSPRRLRPAFAQPAARHAHLERGADLRPLVQRLQRGLVIGQERRQVVLAQELLGAGECHLAWRRGRGGGAGRRGARVGGRRSFRARRSGAGRRRGGGGGRAAGRPLPQAQRPAGDARCRAAAGGDEGAARLMPRARAGARGAARRPTAAPPPPRQRPRRAAWVM
jgi:hypothetical protein